MSERPFDVLAAERVDELLRSGSTPRASPALVDRGAGRILGAHLLCGDADETIRMFALALRHGLTARDVKTSILVHPAAASDITSMV